MVLEVLFFHVLLHVCNSGIYDFWRIVCCGFAFKYVFLSASPFLSWQYLIHVMHADIFKLSHSGNSDVRYNYKYS